MQIKESFATRLRCTFSAVDLHPGGIRTQADAMTDTPRRQAMIVILSTSNVSKALNRKITQKMGYN
jgi:hypothetical protein